MNPTYFSLAVVIGIAISNPDATALAAGGHTYEFGAPGNAAEAARTITVDLTHNYYEPDAISVKQGETIRFVLKNTEQLRSVGLKFALGITHAGQSRLARGLVV